MNLPNNKFCVLPWISLETSPIGTVRPCCLADDEIVDEHGVKYRLGHADFDEIRDSAQMRGLRRSFLAGEQPQTCRRCWAEEDAGRTSKRMHTLQRLNHLDIAGPWTEEYKDLMFIDFKLGNICNLKCRICGSWSSSSFATEELKFSPEKKQSFHYQMLRDGAWPRKSPEFWSEIEDYMSQIRYLEFTGGEPFMIQEHFDLLESLVNHGHAHSIEIHYNTNGTQWPEHAEEIWRHFRHVEIAFSIDDVGARFEYQRSNAVWTEVESNLQQFVAMRERNKNISLQVCSTVNVFNVMYLETLAAWIDQQSFDFVYWNMLHDGPQYCIANLPETVKNTVEQKLRSAKFSPAHQKEINHIIEFMRGRQGNNGQDLIASIQQLDYRRNQSLAAVAPELAQALGL